MTAGGQYLDMAPEFPCSSPPSAAPAYSTLPRPKPRPVKYRSTCDNCHRLKVKCGQEKDSCSRCRASGEKCVYGISQRKGKPKSVRDAAAARRTMRLAHQGVPAHRSQVMFEFCHMDDPMAFQMQLPSPTSPSSTAPHHTLAQHRFQDGGGPSGLGDYHLMGTIGLPDMGWDNTIIAAEPARGRSTSPGAGAFEPRRASQSDDLSCSPPHSAASSRHSHLDALYTASVNTHIAEPAADSADQSSLAFTVPPPVLPSCTPSFFRPPQRCSHEAFLLERLVNIEATSNPPSQPPSESGSTRPDDGALDEGRKFSLSFEQLLSLGQSTLPPPTTLSILACDSCAVNPSITLYFILLINKVLALYVTFLEGCRASTSYTDISSSQKSAPSTPASTTSSSSASWGGLNPLSICPLSPQLAKGPASAPFLEAFGLSTTEQTAVLKLLLKSRLGDLRTLIIKLRARVEESGCMQRACEPVVVHVGQRLDAVEEELDGVL